MSGLLVSGRTPIFRIVNAFDQPDPEVVPLAEEGRQGVIRMQGLQRE